MSWVTSNCQSLSFWTITFQDENRKLASVDIFILTSLSTMYLITLTIGQQTFADNCIVIFTVNFRSQHSHKQTHHWQRWKLKVTSDILKVKWLPENTAKECCNFPFSFFFCVYAVDIKGWLFVLTGDKRTWTHKDSRLRYIRYMCLVILGSSYILHLERKKKKSF